MAAATTAPYEPPATRQLVGKQLRAQRRARLRRRFLGNASAVGGAVIVLLLVVMAVAAPLITQYGPIDAVLTDVNLAASADHWFGTDPLGRDIFTRVVYGARVSLFAGTVSVVFALVVGVPLGAYTGYYQNFLSEHVVMRIIDALQAFPFIILALGVVAVLGAGLLPVTAALGVGFIPHIARVTRAQVLTQRKQEYVEAAINLGASDRRILVRHILPNAMSPIIVQATLAVGIGILGEAALSFLGLGVNPPTASWGADLRTAQGHLFSNLGLALWPGVAIFLAILGFNLLGDGMRDVLDPRAQQREA